MSAAAKLVRAKAYELLAEAERIEAAELAGVPVAEQSKPRQRTRARPLVGPLRPVTDDVAVARAKRQQLGWNE